MSRLHTHGLASKPRAQFHLASATPYMLHAPLSGDESQVTRRCDYVRRREGGVRDSRAGRFYPSTCCRFSQFSTKMSAWCRRPPPKPPPHTHPPSPLPPFSSSASSQPG
uniref:Uncharacterized protein n=1 Tax=Gadus morhua TaxID=8049 RepID=A0A8C5AD93_GADMO